MKLADFSLKRMMKLTFVNNQHDDLSIEQPAAIINMMIYQPAVLQLANC